MIQRIIIHASRRLGVPADGLDASTELRALGDSLDMLDLLNAIETDLAIEFPPNAIAGWKTLDDIARAAEELAR